MNVVMQFQALLPPWVFSVFQIFQVGLADAALERSRGLSLCPESQLWAGMEAGMDSNAFPIININVATQITVTQSDLTGLDDTWTYCS